MELKTDDKPSHPYGEALLRQALEALKDALSVCRSVSTCKTRRTREDGVTMYAQTEEWCRWVEDEVGPKVDAAGDALIAALAEPVATAEVSLGAARAAIDADQDEQDEPVICWKCGSEDGGTSCGVAGCGLIEAEPAEQAQPDAAKQHVGCLGMPVNVSVTPPAKQAQPTPPTSEAGWLHRLDLEKSEAWLAGYAQGLRRSAVQPQPVAWRYWKDKFACWEYSDVQLEYPAVPAGTQMCPLYTPAPIAPPGWRMVPVEPTHAMYEAAWAVPSDQGFEGIYRAMLAAAPEVPSLPAPQPLTSEDIARFVNIARELGSRNPGPSGPGGCQGQAMQPRSSAALPMSEIEKIAHRTASRDQHSADATQRSYIFQIHTLEDLCRALERECKLPVGALLRSAPSSEGA